MTVPKFELILAGVLVVVVAGLVFGQTRVQHSSPGMASSGFLAAAAAADLGALREVSTVGHYAEVQLRVCKPRFEVAERVFEKTIPRLAQADWQGLWRKVDLLASGEYERLHKEVAQLGRRRFEELEATERMDLIGDRERYEAFVYRAGVEALPLGDSGRISSAAAFQARSDRNGFIANEGWEQLSDEDRALLGSPLALASGNTVEKLAFYDRVAMPKLEPDDREAIEGIAREDVAGLQLFAARHGERLLQQALESAGLAALGTTNRCIFPREEQGSLFRGAAATCTGFVSSARGGSEIDVNLVKLGFKWRVAGVSDKFFSVVGRS